MNSTRIKRLQSEIQNRIQSGVVDLPQGKPEHQRIVYLMRGLPSCGKSTTAKKLAGKNGVVIETDAFFQIQGAGPEGYSFDRTRLPEARNWTFELFRQAIRDNVSPIVIDRGNGSNRDSREYAEIALAGGYELELREPESNWWQEIKVLLRYRPETDDLLDLWAMELAQLSKRTHRVNSETIRHWMDRWKDDLTVSDILSA